MQQVNTFLDKFNRFVIPASNMSTTAPAAAATSGLTPEGMMLYCASQLRYLDEGIAAHMATQQQAHTTVSRLNDLKTALGKSAMGPNDSAVKAQTVGAFEAAYDALPPGDLEMRAKLNEQFHEFIADAYCADGHATVGEYNLGSIGQNEIDKLDAAARSDTPGNAVSSDDLKRYSAAVDSLSTDLGKGAELDMINLQSLVSQRQMAVQLTTQIISKINEGCMAVVGQIGK